MKKVSILSVFVFVFLFASAITEAGSFQWVENPNHPNHKQNGGVVSPPEKDRPTTDKAEIYHIIVGAAQDDNFNWRCVSYIMSQYFTVPPEGASFFIVEYCRIRGDGETEWGEWIQTGVSPVYDLSSEMAAISHSEYRNGFWKFEGVSFGPSEAEFKTEIYSPEDELLDVFITPFDNGYWQPRLESEDYDDMPSVVTPTPTPAATPTPTPVVVGSISGTVTKEKGGKPLNNAKVTIAAGNFFSDRTKTDGNGKYSFEGLNTQKEYSVTASKSGYQPETKMVYLEGESNVDFSLKKK